MAAPSRPIAQGKSTISGCMAQVVVVEQITKERLFLGEEFFPPICAPAFEAGQPFVEIFLLEFE